MTPSQYLIEYRDAAGNLLLPQYGGCFHDFHPEVDDFYDDRIIVGVCSKCGYNDDGEPVPNLATPQGFIYLWEMMKAREDWERFKRLAMNGVYYKGKDYIDDDKVDPATFPETVASYLKGLER